MDLFQGQDVDLSFGPETPRWGEDGGPGPCKIRNQFRFFGMDDPVIVFIDNFSPSNKSWKGFAGSGD